MTSAQIYTAAQRVAAAHGWHFQETDNCDLFAGMPPLLAVLREIRGEIALGISNPREGRIGVRRDLRPDIKPQVLLHELAHCFMDHKNEEPPDNEAAMEARELHVEREAETVCKLAYEQLGHRFELDRGLVMPQPTPEVRKVAHEIAREVYAHVRE